MAAYWTRTKLAYGMGAVVGALIFVGIPAGDVLAAQGGANSSAQPADKIAVAGSSVEVMTTENARTLSQSLFEPVPTIKISRPTDLLITVSLECATFTETLVSDNPAFGPQLANAEARVVVWIELDGRVVPVDRGDTNDRLGNRAGEVVFCAQAQEMEYLEQENDDDQHNATIRHFHDAKQANSFEWIAINPGFSSDNPHTIEVMARLSWDFSPDNCECEAHAAVGKRTLVVEPVKLANNAEI